MEGSKGRHGLMREEAEKILDIDVRVDVECFQGGEGLDASSLEHILDVG